VSILEKLERDENSPQYVEQWLGYYLLFLDGREIDAIKYSLNSYTTFPDNSSGLFNAACGYAQLYKIELDEVGAKEILTSQNRLESLRLLRQAIRVESGLKALARKHPDEGDSFESLEDDVEFLRITEPRTSA